MGYKENFHLFQRKIRFCQSKPAREINNLAPSSLISGIHSHFYFLFVFFWRYNPQWARASSFTKLLDHTQRRTTDGRTPLDEESARRKGLFLTIQNTHNRQTSRPLVGFELIISAGERPQTYALNRAATGTGLESHYLPNHRRVGCIFLRM